MSSSSRRVAMAEGVGDSPERVRSIFPFWLMNCRSIFGVRAGPSPEAGLAMSPSRAILKKDLWILVEE